MRAQWRVADADVTTRQALAAATGLSPLFCQVLINRGITDAAAAQAFLTPSLHDLHDPYGLHGMAQAVQRLVTAIRQGERIAIYGDYDVDGVTATALLVTFFHELGLQVPYYIPERASEGYGLNADSMRQLASAGTRLLITVDCGSTAWEEVALARRLGMDIIITDHHQPPARLPEACAVLNPHQPACTYPNKYLCGVGVVGFQLAPRLNASGRLGSATHSVALLTAHDAHEAERLAQLLDTVNQQRRTLQQAMETAVHERIAQQYNSRPPAAIVLGDPAWHLGVVGIVAAKIVEAYHRPTFLLHINGDTARGSGRSIPSFNLYHGLQHCAQWLRQFGGHKYAAGLTMDTAHLPFLQEDLIRFAADTLSPEDLQPILHLDAVVALADITPALVAELERCEPHGAGNPTPLFCAHAVQLASPVRRLGQQGQHARFRVTQAGATLNVVAFHQAEQVLALPAGAVVDLAFTPTINSWRDQSQLELHLRALRPHTS